MTAFSAGPSGAMIRWQALRRARCSAGCAQPREQIAPHVLGGRRSATLLEKALRPLQPPLSVKRLFRHSPAADGAHIPLEAR